jgi:cytochrome c-type biogenesis protein CcmE
VTPKRKRLWLLVRSLGVLAVAAALVLSALSDNIVFFYSPSQLAEKHVPAGHRFRIGGLVEPGSVHKEGSEARFRVTDLNRSVEVVYRGILPDLFREGQGVIAERWLSPDGIFSAHEVLAKHDEKYMPPEAAKGIEGIGTLAGRPENSEMMICRQPSQMPVRVVSSVRSALSEGNGKDLWSASQKIPHFVRDHTVCGRKGDA